MKNNTLIHICDAIILPKDIQLHMTGIDRMTRDFESYRDATSFCDIYDTKIRGNLINRPDQRDRTSRGLVTFRARELRRENDTLPLFRGNERNKQSRIHGDGIVDFPAAFFSK